MMIFCFMRKESYIGTSGVRTLTCIFDFMRHVKLNSFHISTNLFLDIENALVNYKDVQADIYFPS